MNKILQITDLIQWHEKEELSISPKYQRNAVWNEKAKSYLIDSIIRGYPIPPIFLRSTIDVVTKSTFKEIIDGQQRVRTILEFIVEESFPIQRSHNKEFGGKKYSELSDSVKERILSYQISAETISEKDDSIIFSMFARLNANNCVLNKQETRNSQFWGDFKVFAYRMTKNYTDFFLEYSLLNSKDCSRMKDTELINSMIILLLDGVVGETVSVVDSYYRRYDGVFSEVEDVEVKLEKTMSILRKIYKYLGGQLSIFGNKNYFFTLFCVLINQMYGIKGSGIEGKRDRKLEVTQIDENMPVLYSKILRFINEFETNIDDKNNTIGLYASFKDFSQNHSQKTTSKAQRLSRIQFLNNYLGNDAYDS